MWIFVWSRLGLWSNTYVFLKNSTVTYCYIPSANYFYGAAMPFVPAKPRGECQFIRAEKRPRRRRRSGDRVP